MPLATNFVLVMGIVLSILPIISLLKLKEKSTSQYILAIFWVLVLNVLMYSYATLHELSTFQFITNFLQDGLWFFIPPLLYVFVKSIFLKKSNFLRKNIKHFIVFFVYFFDYTVPMSISPNTKYIETIHRLFPNWDLIQGIFGVVYFVMTLRLFYQFRDAKQQEDSIIGEKGYAWIGQFLTSIFIVLLLDLGITFPGIDFGQIANWAIYIPSFFLVATMTYLGYTRLTQATLILTPFLIEEETKEDQFTTSYLKLSEKEVLNRRFKRCMRMDKMYLLQDLNSKSLAFAMGTSERKLSAFFKEALDTNFYDAINTYRVEEAKQILQTDALKNHSITGIAHSCGFRSKSSFYRIFKKHTNLSPMDYVKTGKNGSHHP